MDNYTLFEELGAEIGRPRCDTVWASPRALTSMSQSCIAKAGLRLGFENVTDVRGFKRCGLGMEH